MFTFDERVRREEPGRGLGEGKKAKEEESGLRGGDR